MQSLGAARQPAAFYGWYMVFFCIVVRGFTAPGQTIGVSAFTDDLIDSLGTSRSAVATAYLIGTLGGATVLPLVGRRIDRLGVKRMLGFVAPAFACVVALTSTVQNVAMLAVAFLGLRMLGQGAMSLIGSQGVVMWFEHRRGFALAVTTMGTVAVMSMAPLTFGAISRAIGWRLTWVVLGVGVAVVIIPMARFLIIDRPEHLSQRPDGPTTAASGALDEPIHRQRSATVAEALRTPAFWALTGIMVMAGAFVTGLTFHNTDLLGEQGLTETQAAAIFIPQLVGSVAASFIVGSLTDRIDGRPLMFFSGTALAVGIFLAVLAEPGAMAAVYGLATGVAAGSTFAMAGALMPKWFGVDNIGSIQSIASTMNVGASAVGPVILSIGNDVADSYEPVVTWCAGAAFAMAVASLVVKVPTGG